MIEQETADFLQDLKANNNRDWFEANKARYEAVFKKPATHFCDSMSEQLRHQTGLAYRAKLFRIFRDIRFSKDKTPYNAHMHISFTPVGLGEDAPAWLIGLEPDRLVMGTGIFMFSKSGLDKWRERLDGAEGKALAGVLEQLRSNGARIEEPELKRVPAPFKSGHPQGDLLRRKGLAVWTDMAVQPEIYGEEAPASCWARLEPLQPVFDWLCALAESSS